MMQSGTEYRNYGPDVISSSRSFVFNCILSKVHNCIGAAALYSMYTNHTLCAVSSVLWPSSTLYSLRPLYTRKRKTICVPEIIMFQSTPCLSKRKNKRFRYPAKSYLKVAFLSDTEKRQKCAKRPDLLRVVFAFK